jgi:cobalt-zinc-cadmium efflux system outer membrane protein
MIAAAVNAIDLPSAHADDPGAGPRACVLPLTRDNLVRCALRASLRARVERDEAKAIEGRLAATDPVLPSNPVVSALGSRRLSPGPELVTYNWSAQIAQEVEIAGQRGARRRTALAEREAQSHVVIATDREAAVDAWNAFFTAIAARETLQLAVRLQALSTRVNDATRAAAENGLVPAVDADVAEATFLRVVQEQILAEQASERANNTLATLLGIDPANPVPIQGDLEPLQLDGTDAADTARARVEALPQIQSLEASRQSMQSRADYYRRARWPNPTFSVFGQNDETNHLVLGLGVAVPIALPQPIGRTYAGEIDESLALADKLAAQTDQMRREAHSELNAAAQAYRSSLRVRAAYTDALLERAEKSLQSITAQIEAGRVAARDVIVAQQALMDMLRTSIDARLALCLASVRLAKASGVRLEQGAAP